MTQKKLLIDPQNQEILIEPEIAAARFNADKSNEGLIPMSTQDMKDVYDMFLDVDLIEEVTLQ